MSDETSKALINLGDYSKPANTLIEKVSEAVGGLFRPYQIKRIAKAEVEANLIKTQGIIQVAELQQRAVRRFIEEEAKKQLIMEQIVEQSLPQLKEDSSPDKIEVDWLTNFFDKCRIISDIEMQSLWSRILAGEANSPGSFSKRTVNFLSDLDKGDAILFTKLCGFGWHIGNIVPLVYDEHNEIYIKNGINFNTLTHLDSIGLIQFNAIAGFLRTKLPKSFKVAYYGQIVECKMSKDKENEMNIGNVLLTKTGEELARICGSKPVEGFKVYILEQWKLKGYLESQ